MTNIETVVTRIRRFMGRCDDSSLPIRGTPPTHMLPLLGRVPYDVTGLALARIWLAIPRKHTFTARLTIAPRSVPRPRPDSDDICYLSLVNTGNVRYMEGPYINQDRLDWWHTHAATAGWYADVRSIWSIEPRAAPLGSDKPMFDPTHDVICAATDWLLKSGDVAKADGLATLIFDRAAVWESLSRVVATRPRELLSAVHVLAAGGSVVAVPQEVLRELEFLGTYDEQRRWYPSPCAKKKRGGSAADSL